MQDCLVDDCCFGLCDLLRVRVVCIVHHAPRLCTGAGPCPVPCVWLSSMLLMICLCVVCCVAMLALPWPCLSALTHVGLAWSRVLLSSAHAWWV